MTKLTPVRRALYIEISALLFAALLLFLVYKLLGWQLIVTLAIGISMIIAMCLHAAVVDREIKSLQREIDKLTDATKERATESVEHEVQKAAPQADRQISDISAARRFSFRPGRN